MRTLLHPFLVFAFLVPLVSIAQYGSETPPDRLYGPLFKDVQKNRVFRDGKTFVDCVPKRSPAQIVADYLRMKNNPAVRYSLQKFVADNFNEPVNPADTYVSDRNEDVVTHIKKLWQVLKREPDARVEGSSLLPLPYSYIVPGGRFREVYYWDSYFTMLGLQESGEYGVIENMIRNFAYMIQHYGHIPNGNRSYYLSRSQPPYFAMMLGLLAEKQGNMVYGIYQPALKAEYDYYMDRAAPTRHVVRMPDGSTLNRYWDQDSVPRQESWAEDSITAARVGGNRSWVLRNLRSGAESGWDFSSRWFSDGQHLTSIRVTDIVPVDLNGLLYQLELALAKSFETTGNPMQARYYRELAEKRKAAVNKYCWSEKDGWYYDYDLSSRGRTAEKTIAGASPLFFGIAPQTHAPKIAAVVKREFLAAGGILTTLKNTGEQWDAPNGWAPLQWLTIKGLDNYGQKELASDAANRWIKLNTHVYKSTGKLNEKYNVKDLQLEAGGGEYPSQDGFGWTNGVLLKLISLYGRAE